VIECELSVSTYIVHAWKTTSYMTNVQWLPMASNLQAFLLHALLVKQQSIELSPLWKGWTDIIPINSLLVHKYNILEASW